MRLRHADFQGSLGAGPLKVADGASGEPIDWTALATRYRALEQGEEVSAELRGHVCLSWVSWTLLGSICSRVLAIVIGRYTPCGGVPVLETAVDYLMTSRYSRPSAPELAVLSPPPSQMKGEPLSLKRLSPEEDHYAVILATARDLSKNVLVQDKQNCLGRVCFCRNGPLSGEAPRALSRGFSRTTHSNSGRHSSAVRKLEQTMKPCTRL